VVFKSTKMSRILLSFSVLIEGAAFNAAGFIAISRKPKAKVAWLRSREPRHRGEDVLAAESRPSPAGASFKGSGNRATAMDCGPTPREMLEGIKECCHEPESLLVHINAQRPR
jgi:hypothetical protein